MKGQVPMTFIHGLSGVPYTGTLHPLAVPALPPLPSAPCRPLPPAHRTPVDASVAGSQSRILVAGYALCAFLHAAREQRRRAGLQGLARAEGSASEADGGGALKVKSRRVGIQRPSTEQRLREVELLVSEDGDDGSPETSQAPPALDPDVVRTFAARYSDVRRELPRALPFLPEPGYRSFAGNVPGDAGFDPVGLCTDVKTFVNYREAELKHGRLAMLAAVAWPLAELGEQQLLEENGYPDFLAESGGRLLPQLTGGLGDQFVESFVAVVLLVGAFFELNFTRPKGAAPGDYKFDTLGLAGLKAPSWARVLLPRGRPWMQEAEIKHGRIAMLAVLYDIVDELLTGNPVVEDTEFFFHRIDAKLLRWEYWTFQPETLDTAGLESLS